MTRAEFIAYYSDNSNFPVGVRRPWGVEIDGWKKYAVPCHCGDESCKGWAMLSAENLPVHFEMYYHPDDDRE